MHYIGYLTAVTEAEYKFRVWIMDKLWGVFVTIFFKSISVSWNMREFVHPEENTHTNENINIQSLS